jgi:hypothetical protein
VSGRKKRRGRRPRARPPSRETADQEQARLEAERAAREAQELASFERRAEWLALHYGGAADRADELRRKAIEHAEQMPSEPDDDRPPRAPGGAC